MQNSELFFNYLSFSNPWLVAIALNTFLLAIATVSPKKLLTPAGQFHGWLLGVVIWGCLGWRGYAVVMFYFLVGSSVTRIGKAQKEAEGIAEKRSGARGPENVWGSALTATFCAVGVLALSILGDTGNIFADTGKMPVPQDVISLLLLGYAASFCTKLSDTCASEIGKAYGKHTFLITTLQPVPRGTEGAVSLEGTIAGIVGSILIALLSWAAGLIDLTGIVFCIIAAFIATNIESVIGATVQSKFEWLTNEVVNFFNTLIGAICAIVLAYVWKAFLV
ncbi:TIGR00297 family protein [Microcoleus sp. LEGE 07076]|uniref:TIGR00297 family protein n=1 Tax=Microcoleus sp. LEGE 07076 TaxID=915322 RepID=UPI00187FC6D6|nr:TIGR00297 family protein [Microcoleus sp. LEGE 07076]MBE9185236.1 TIGR00297 family protein [Microcoleus sp. LEGE 07076]